MSTKVCVVCNTALKEGDRAEVLVRATYHALKSKVVYALDTDDMEVVDGTLCHVECADSPDSYS